MMFVFYRNLSLRFKIALLTGGERKGLTYDAKSKVSPFTLPVLMSL